MTKERVPVYRRTLKSEKNDVTLHVAFLPIRGTRRALGVGEELGIDEHIVIKTLVMRG